MAAEQTITTALARRYREEPEAEYCHLLDRDGGATVVTVATLMRRSMAFAARFGATPDDGRIVGVCLSHGLDLHAAFFGAIWAGRVPTMLPPPSPRMDPEKY